MAIHHHFPGDQAHIEAQRLLNNASTGCRMQGYKHQRGGGAMAYQLIYKNCAISWHTRIGKLASPPGKV